MNIFVRFSSFRLSSTFIDIGAQMKQLNDHGQFYKSIILYENHIQKNKETKLTSLATNQALRACIELDDFKRGEKIHKNLSPYLSKNSFIQTNLIRLYMKSGDIVKSQEIFKTSASKTTVMFNSILEGLLDNNRCEEALDLFQQTNIVKNEYTYSILFKICAKIGNQSSSKFGKISLDTMPLKFKDNDIVVTSALQMFIKCGDMTMAEQLFIHMKKNLFAYGAMMNGFVLNNMAQRAIDLFLTIDTVDNIIYTILFNACAQLKTKDALDLGRKVFKQLPKKYRQSTDVLYSVLNMFIKCDDLENAESLFHHIDRDLISYGSMMKFYNNKDQPEMTLKLFEQMKQEKIKPNKIIFVLLINASSVIGDLSLCESLISQIPQSLFSDPWIQTGLVDVWGKIGSPDKAKAVFDTIEQPNVISFSAMINAYGLNGMGFEAVQLFHDVPLHMLDNCIYVCVLNACSHSGLVNEAYEIFEKIPINQRTEQIYTTMIDTFSRVFAFDQAEKFIEEFEKSHPPSIPMYMSMLSSARNEKNASLSQKIFDRIQSKFSRIESCLTSSTVLLANTYALTGDKSMASNIRMKLMELSTKKMLGLCWTVVNGKVFKFQVHDKSHPFTRELYQELDRLKTELTEHGYKPDDSWITRPIKDDETSESILWGHSERLAIAFNLIQRPTPTRIQIVKNLRICGDCHLATKLIARIRQCTIIVRDANRIHHFYPNGQCSCQDHF